MKKAHNYRGKPSEEFTKLFNELQATRLFLVQETGPTKFCLQDEREEFFKVEIGNSIKCSCGGGRDEHCIHTVYSQI